MNVPIILTLALFGCSSADYGTRSDDGDFLSDTGAQGPNQPGVDGDTDDGGGSEDESDKLLLRPAQTDVYIFIANPDRDTVTRVNVRTQAVRTTRVGRFPSVVRTTADYTTALVFNRGDDSVSILDAESLDQAVVPVRDNMNQLALTPDGRWAVLWHDIGAERSDDPPVGSAVSYNEVSVVDVLNRRHIPLVVGFNPKDVTFTPDGSLALVVADASMAAIHLDSADPTPEFIQIADPLDPPVAEEVVVTPDGAFAFVRQRNTDALTLVNLATRDVDSLPVGSDPTDLDLTPDGTGAVVVSRGAREVSVFSTTNPFALPRVVPFPDDTALGAVIVGPNNTAILYTTASPVARYATWDLISDVITMRPLAKPAVSVTRTPTGTSLLVVHTKADSPDGSTPPAYRGKEAVSLIDAMDFRTNTIVLSKPVSGIANSNDGKRGYLVLDGAPVLEVLDYTSLLHDPLVLRSNPVFVGVLPDLDTTDGDEPPAWVTQEHPLGRISFFDPDVRTLETITGFELNGAIEE